ncbi:hypothetical protein CMI48_02560 [Candidatus Pacearchaeota archaeon]|jgi:predicted RNA binding protein YcfA (HicA-like mRNA interferase family)|nr:hypothetical protein [Candidatus Pacearchaeota archaeon]|tara:strand:+ start:159 stop:380 length:222 start_codon:yes stop_codon:yes gene_type:complete
MKSRNLKVRKVLAALKKYGCLEIRNTSHGVIIENPNNKRSTNVPTHQDILPVWIYKNILRQLDIKREDLEKHL